MDNVKRYDSILKTYIEELTTAYETTPVKGMEYSCSIDSERLHYQLFQIGWQQDHYVHLVLLHLAIKPSGKIWILQNRTDILVGKELQKRGVLATDIVIGFRPAYIRQLSEYAVE